MACVNSLGQDRTCSREKETPQTHMVEAQRGGKSLKYAALQYYNTYKY